MSGVRGWVVAVLLIPILTAACEDGGSRSGTAETSASLAAVAFLQKDGAAVRRDEPLVLVFSEPLDPASVGPGTVRVLRRRGSLPLPVSVEVDGNRLLVRPPSPFGFDGNARFRLRVEGFPSLSALRSRDGRPLDRRFRGQFRTSRFYGPDVTPPVLESLAPAPDVGDRWSLVFRFSESMEVSSIALGRSFRVRDAGGGEAVPGVLAHDHLARAFRFQPVEGHRPAAISVHLTSQITDLAGNPLTLPEGTPGEFTFRLSDAPVSPLAGEIVEHFSDQVMRDPVWTTALWNAESAPGVLLGDPASTELLIGREAEAEAEEIALGAETVLAQMLLTKEELGPARELTGLYLFPEGAVAAGEYESLRVMITPTQRDRLADRGRDLGPPLTVIDQRPFRPEPGRRERISVPFSRTFSYDGTTNLLLEITVDPGDRANFLGARFARPGTALVERGGEKLEIRPRLALRGFSLDPRATSRFYDTGLEAPVYLEPILEPVVLPAGVRLEIRYQGARRLDVSGALPGDGSGQPSPWVSSTGELRGYRYLRFEALFLGVSFDEEKPLLDALRIPYR